MAVLAGLLFKIGAAHFWVPDVIDRTPPPGAAIVTTVPKIGGLVAAVPAARRSGCWPN